MDKLDWNLLTNQRLIEEKEGLTELINYHRPKIGSIALENSYHSQRISTISIELHRIEKILDDRKCSSLSHD